MSFKSFFLLSLLTFSSMKLEPYIKSIGSTGLAILVGVFISNLIKSDEILIAGKFAEKKILPIAISLIGANLNIFTLISLGPKTLIYILFMVFAVLGTALYAGHFFKLTKGASLLIGGGNAICGSSAVAGLAPVSKASETEIGLSIAIVNLLGTIGMFLLPPLLIFFNFNEEHQAFIIGGVLQAVGHVVACGDSMGERVREISIIVKMGRVLMLGPMVLLMGILFPKLSKEEQQKDTLEKKEAANFPVPWFVWGFFLLSILGSFQLLTPSLLNQIKMMGNLFLTFAMVGIGFGIRIKSFLKIGPRVLIFGLFIFSIQLIFAFSLNQFI